jgi:hypothetical protein
MLKKHIRYIILIFSVFVSIEASSQKQLSACFDMGENNVSDGLFAKSLVRGSYEISKNKLEGGVQFELKSSNDFFLSGIYLKYSHSFTIKKFPFDVQGFYIHNGFSGMLFESDKGLLVDIKRKHFSYKIGTNFRTYGFTKSAIKEYGLSSNTKTHENWNVMYQLCYDLKLAEHKWNAGLTLTNIDNFLINQETNPFCNLHGHYKLSEPLTLFAELWYKSSGNFNLNVNYFGFFIRAGILWNVN